MLSVYHVFALALVASAVSAQTFNRAAPLSGSISPITEDPIPAWANIAADQCRSIDSCDSCPTTESNYCRWQDSGKTVCCERATEAETSVSEQTNSESMFGSLKSFFGSLLGGNVESVAIQQAKIMPSTDVTEPESAVISPVSSETEPESGSVTPLKGEMEPESGAVTPLKSEAEPESAQITPIKENPIPTWASAADYCIGSESCDDCPLQGYCRYSALGAASCCVKSSDKQRLAASVSAQKPAADVSEQSVYTQASIAPIAEPEGASANDVCRLARSCDMCTKEQYCRMSAATVSRCCTVGSVQHASVSVQTAESQPESAQVTPSSSEAQPESAQITPINSEMSPESASVTPIKGEVEPESASIMPITENPIPAWASASDVCLKMPSCDDCNSQQYCQYSEQGKPSCCGKISLTA